MAIVLMILGFVWWWPVGLVILGFLLARRRYGFRQIYAGEGPMFDWSHNSARWERRVARAQEKVEQVRGRMERRCGSGAWFAPAASGNHAFDEYRSETLRRLEDEQREFKDFLGRLRVAKDRAEFDQFMAARREPPAPPAPEAPHAG